MWSGVSFEDRYHRELRTVAGGAPAPCPDVGLRGHRPRDDRRDERSVARVVGVRPLRRAVPEGPRLRHQVRRRSIRRLPLPLGSLQPLLRRVSVRMFFR